jgi:hypothetical protein
MKTSPTRESDTRRGTEAAGEPTAESKENAMNEKHKVQRKLLSFDIIAINELSRSEL